MFPALLFLGFRDMAFQLLGQADFDPTCMHQAACTALQSMHVSRVFMQDECLKGALRTRAQDSRYQTISSSSLSSWHL